MRKKKTVTIVRWLIPAFLAISILLQPNDQSFAALAKPLPAHGSGGVGFVSANGSSTQSRGDLPVISGQRDRFKISFSDGRFIEVPTGKTALDRFYGLWYDLHFPGNGYFSLLDIPYHSIETFIVEAPDYGHLTTSEAFSYWVWLEAAFAEKTGDLSTINYAFEVMEQYAIPKIQPNVQSYQAYRPATYAPEKPDPSLYPVRLDQNVPVGQDPIAEELKAQYGSEVYGMHWLIDVDNWYGFGGQGKQPTMINTFQRGLGESVWEAIPHPSVEEFAFGAERSGYLSLFNLDSGGYSRQWRYTSAPDADARVIQAVYGLLRHRPALVQNPTFKSILAKSQKMGDFLRYATYDKYFKPIGCQSPQCPPTPSQTNNHASRHDLLGWYYAWGGATASSQGQWSWRIGGSHVHFGYQNPVTALALSSENSLLSKTSSGVSAWRGSLKKQKEFYQWLQSKEGAFAGGATNSLGGSYEAAEPGRSTFYGLFYEENPVYNDPGSNTWFGWQAWSVQRLAEYQLYAKDPAVETSLDLWVDWVLGHVNLGNGLDFTIPSTLAWEGQPDPWTGQGVAGGPTLRNSQLQVKVLDTTRDVGITSALAKTLIQYAAAHPSNARSRQARETGEALLNRLWEGYRDTLGLSVPEQRADYKRYVDLVPIPDSYNGRMPGGAAINTQSTFISLRPQYAQDPGFQYVVEKINRQEVPTFRYHRFWAQVEAALAFAELDTRP